MKEVAIEIEGLTIMGKHPWGKVDHYMEETEHLLNAPTQYSFNIDDGIGSSSTTEYDSMRNDVPKLVNDGR